MDEQKLLEEQLAYYRARAGEYDEWFLREVDKGLAAADRGELVDHADLES